MIKTPTLTRSELIDILVEKQPHLEHRVGRNPKTGESVAVEDKFSPHFKPGKELKERVDSVNKNPQGSLFSSK